MDIQAVIERQRTFFAGGATRDPVLRRERLRRLRQAIRERETAIAAALREDLGKSETEAYMTEIGMTLGELDYMIRHVERFSRPQRVKTPLAQFPAASRRVPEPFGTVLIMSPWNYPFMLTLEPLVDALAAGNTAVVKPSAYAPATSAVIRELLESVFPPEWVAVAEGGRAVNQALLDQRWDTIFFTGGIEVGRLVLEKAAPHLTPVTLELGGKSPCIVDETADLPLAARRIVFGKFLNAGQTCVAPDYLLVQEAVKDRLVENIRAEIRRQFGDDPLKNPDYGKIINGKHFNRLIGLMQSGRAVVGGRTDGVSRIEPTLLDEVTPDSAVMGEEIFGPLLPVLPYSTLDEAMRVIERHPTPLALYLFTTDKAAERRVLSSVRFGGGCVNDTVVHLATSHMGFGGVGASGMGSYHGRQGFDTFTHYKSIVKQKPHVDIPLRYQPYTPRKAAWLRRFFP